MDSQVSGFKDYTVEERLAILTARTQLDEVYAQRFSSQGGLKQQQANSMVENVIGMISLPVGVATNFKINGRDYFVPMATEEPSVIAAASNAAKMARGKGGFTVTATDPVMIAQIQLLGVKDPSAARLRLLEARDAILEAANAFDPTLVNFGGGARDIQVRIISTEVGQQVVVHLHVDVQDAMGANTVNTMAEGISSLVAEIAGGVPLLRILSNKADQRLVRVRATFPAEAIGGDEVVDKIVAAAAFADADPYRAATHNKGIMNGITAVVLATGNDTRAVESGCHSHAVTSKGHYGSLSRFEKDSEGNIVATMELPIAVGLVGGATKAHPTAQAALKILGVNSATELAMVIAAVGLAQNFAACRALAAEGIQKGHMGLHARMIATTAGAIGEQVNAVAKAMIAAGKINMDCATEMLEALRKEEG